MRPGGHNRETARLEYAVPGRRISIVGSTGSGKTYLARELARKLGLQHIELDGMRRGSENGQTHAAPAFVQSVEQAVSGDSWIIDGHYRAIRHLVWRRADTVIHLDYPLVLVARHLLKRYLAGRSNLADRGRVHPEPRPASWRRRLERLRKTVTERGEYAQVLAQPDYSHLHLIKFRSPSAAFAWLDDLSTASKAFSATR
ncbi:MAG: adenylate kinase [Sphingomonadaceae bacterium]|nr:MAG: adenylate kinase [Sphingomonadaceae bacterium]